VSSSSFFTLNANRTGSGGMIINNNIGAPYYGYAVGEVRKASTYYDYINDRWKLYVEGSNALNSILEAQNEEIRVNGELNINTDLDVWGWSKFNIATYDQGLGGMSVDVSPSSGVAAPSYGYSVNEIPKALTYFSDFDDSWNVQLVGESNAVIRATEDEVRFGRPIRLLSISPSSSVVGTIFYSAGHFYGTTLDGNIQLDNSSTAQLKSSETMNAEIQEVKMENELLKEQVELLKKQLQKLNERMTKAESNM